MAEKSTIARPYALAVYQHAAAEKKLPQWSEILGVLSSVVVDPTMQTLIGNPRVSTDQLVGILNDACGKKLDQAVKGLISILVENNRLNLLPEILAMYEVYRAESEKVIQAEIVSAFKVTKAQETAIQSALKKRLGREVKIECSTDETLIGGAVIKAGDMVIDGSVTGQLGRLANALS